MHNPDEMHDCGAGGYDPAVLGRGKEVPGGGEDDFCYDIQC